MFKFKEPTKEYVVIKRYRHASVVDEVFYFKTEKVAKEFMNCYTDEEDLKLILLSSENVFETN